MAAWVFSDLSTSFLTGLPNTRRITFNLYNIGNASAEPSSNWSFYYLYYNAYNANDYGILFQDAFNTSVAPYTFSCPTPYNCNFNFSIPQGGSFAQSVFNQPSLYRDYAVPVLNGNYYLVLVADAGGIFNEQNEQNNIFYTTGQFPKMFVNGYSSKSKNDDFKNTKEPNKDRLKKTDFNTAVNEKNRNAYTPQEIMGFIKYKIKTGEIQRKLDSLAKKSPNIPVIYGH